MSSPFDLTVARFWPTTFLYRTWSEHAAEAPGIIELCYALKAQEKVNIASGIATGAKSPAGLHESRFDLFARDHPGLNRLKAFIGETVESAVHHVNGTTADRGRIRIAAVDSWFHITNDGGFHDTHQHTNCSWCGIYYLQISDSGPATDGAAPNGGNRFYSPLRVVGGSHTDFGTQYLDNNGFVDPALHDGLLILFPSYLLHSGLPYRGTKDRIVISLNCQVHLE